MKKLFVVLAAIASLFALASPAQAVHKGKVCKDFNGPDGAPSGSNGWDQQARLCLAVDDHDFEDWIRPIVVVYNDGRQDVEVHVSYLKLIAEGVSDVRNSGPFVRTVSLQHAYTTNWVTNPSGDYNSRIRVWVCWPGLPGDPCGGVVTWSSGIASY